MKKMIVMFAFLIAFMSCIYAVDPLIENSGKLTASTGEIPVTFNLGDGEDSESSWRIGITTDVTNLKSEQITDIDSIALTLQDNNTGKPTGKIYVYWIVKGGQKLKVSLKADGGPLKDDVNTNTIDWSTTWTSTGDSASSTNQGQAQSLGGIPSGEDAIASEKYSAEQIVFDRSVPQTSVETGSAELTIVTEDVTDKAPVSYSSQLTLVVSPVGA